MIMMNMKTKRPIEKIREVISP